MSDKGKPSEIPITPVPENDVIWVPNPDIPFMPSIGPTTPWPDPEPEPAEPPKE
jgi:hypothetical protein